MQRVNASAFIAALVAGSSLYAGTITWDFNDGTTQGWQKLTGFEGQVSNTGTNELQIVGSGGPGNQNIAGAVTLSATVGSTSDHLTFDYSMYNTTPGLFDGFEVWVFTSGDSGYFYQNLPATTTKQTNYQVNLTSMTASVAGETLDVGDTITAIAFRVYVITPDAIYLDNVTLTTATVPEPATASCLGLLAGGACLLRRVRNS